MEDLLIPVLFDSWGCPVSKYIVRLLNNTSVLTVSCSSTKEEREIGQPPYRIVSLPHFPQCLILLIPSFLSHSFPTVQYNTVAIQRSLISAAMIY